MACHPYILLLGGEFLQHLILSLVLISTAEQLFRWAVAYVDIFTYLCTIEIVAFPLRLCSNYIKMFGIYFVTLHTSILYINIFPFVLCRTMALLQAYSEGTNVFKALCFCTIQYKWLRYKMMYIQT